MTAIMLVEIFIIIDGRCYIDNKMSKVSNICASYNRLFAKVSVKNKATVN